MNHIFFSDWFLSAVVHNKYQILEKHAVERLEHDRAGKVAAMLLEIDPKEVLYLIESQDALRKKVADAVESLHLASWSLHLV